LPRPPPPIWISFVFPLHRSFRPCDTPTHCLTFHCRSPRQHLAATLSNHATNPGKLPPTACSRGFSSPIFYFESPARSALRHDSGGAPVPRTPQGSNVLPNLAFHPEHSGGWFIPGLWAQGERRHGSEQTRHGHAPSPASSPTTHLRRHTTTTSELDAPAG